MTEGKSPTFDPFLSLLSRSSRVWPLPSERRAWLKTVAAEVRRRIGVSEMAQSFRLLTSAATGLFKQALSKLAASILGNGKVKRDKNQTLP